MATDQKFEIIRRRAFSAIPDDIFLDKRISLSARTVLAYAIGRPSGWNLHVSNWKTTLGIGDAAWRRISTELKDAGYLYQEQHHHPSGKIFWLNFVTDSPELSPTIPSNTTRGKTTCGKPTNIAIGLEQAIKSSSSYPAADSIFIIENPQDQLLLDALIEQHGFEAIEAEAKALIKAGKRPYISNIKKSLTQKAAAARRQAAEASKEAALTAPLAEDAESFAKGKATLDAIRRRNSALTTNHNTER